MLNDLAAMQTALRVLTAIGKHDRPDPADLSELCRLVPNVQDLPADELACAVIQAALHERASARARGLLRYHKVAT